jgi:Family of unknown function (DUF6283)
MKYIKTPCAECPWRTDVAPGRFSPDRFRKLAPCAEDLARSVFACHKSPEGGEFACAGFLLQSSMHNMSVRMSRHAFDVSSPYPLFATYREMAIANGVPKTDPALRSCRDDGQRR